MEIGATLPTKASGRYLDQIPLKGTPVRSEENTRSFFAPAFPWAKAGRVATLRPALDLPAPEVRGAKSVRLLLVQRSGLRRGWAMDPLGFKCPQ